MGRGTPGEEFSISKDARRDAYDVGELEEEHEDRVRSRKSQLRETTAALDTGLKRLHVCG